MFKRPKNEEELQKREAMGIIRASRFIRKYAKTHSLINVETVKQIHKEIFKNAWPEIAGEYRMENLKITDSKHLPPHYSKVPKLMEIADSELSQHLEKLKETNGIFFDPKELTEDREPTGSEIQSINDIIETAAWTHHLITYIHPFREGNGRTARLVANLILERYGLIGISVKIERENKNRYRQALAQIDKEKDYEPLIDLISEGLLDRYEGVNLKYYNI